MIRLMQANYDRLSQPNAPRWFIYIDKATGQPQAFCPVAYRLLPATWYKASLFTADALPRVSLLAVGAIPVLLVEYLANQLGIAINA